MTGGLHDDELDSGAGTVRALLASQCPQWTRAQVHELDTSGTDNAMWRVELRDEPDVVVRLPRRPGAAAKVAEEVAVLEALATTPLTSIVRTPTVVHRGHAEEVFPHEWSVLRWIDGIDAWTARDSLDADAHPGGDDDVGRGDLTQLAVGLADAVHAVRDLDGLPVGRRARGDRGGPIGPLLRRLDWWLTDPQWGAASFVDVDEVRRLADQAREVVHEPVIQRVVHGDLIPGNLVLQPRAGRLHLAAIIDWGSAALADPAQDLAPAWALFEGRSRDAFRDAMGADEAMWLRARAFELEHAVGGIVYYRPRHHPLGDVMNRTLERILASER